MKIFSGVFYADGAAEAGIQLLLFFLQIQINHPFVVCIMVCLLQFMIYIHYDRHGVSRTTDSLMHIFYH